MTLEMFLEQMVKKHGIVLLEQLIFGYISARKLIEELSGLELEYLVTEKVYKVVSLDFPGENLFIRIQYKGSNYDSDSYYGSDYEKSRLESYKVVRPVQKIVSVYE
jgi:hypothetical protein